MLFLLDICALNHIRELQEHKIFDLRDSIIQFRIGISKTILKEWENYELNHFFSIENCDIFSIRNQDIDIMNTKYPFFGDFDKADQTLLYLSIQKSSIIISDDGGLIAAAISLGNNAFFLPDFCIFLVKENFLSKNEMRKILKFWEKNHRFKLTALKHWNNSLNLIK